MFKKSIFDLLEPTKEAQKDQQAKKNEDEYKKYLDFSQNQDFNVLKPKIDFKFKKQAKIENTIKPAQISKTPEIKKTTSQNIVKPQKNKIKNMMLNLNRSYEDYINFNFQSKEKISKSIQLLNDSKIKEGEKKQHLQVKKHQPNSNGEYKLLKKPDNRIRSSNTVRNNNLSQNNIQQKIEQFQKIQNKDSYLKEINKKQEQQIQHLKEQLKKNQQKIQNESQLKACSDCKKHHKENQCQLKLPKLDYCFDCEKYHDRKNCKTQKKTQKVSAIKQNIQQREMEEEEEELSDSFEQDSFIDDTEYDNYNKQKIMKQLRKVTKYDPNKYKDSLSDDVEEANFDEIQEEEYITKRHAIREDQIELKRIKLDESRPRKY